MKLFDTHTHLNANQFDGIEAEIIENTANKLTQSGKVNELLQSLLDVKSGGDGSA